MVSCWAVKWKTYASWLSVKSQDKPCESPTNVESLMEMFLFFHIQVAWGACTTAQSAVRVYNSISVSNKVHKWQVMISFRLKTVKVRVGTTLGVVSSLRSSVALEAELRETKPLIVVTRVAHYSHKQYILIHAVTVGQVFWTNFYVSVSVLGPPVYF